MIKTRKTKRAAFLLCKLLTTAMFAAVIGLTVTACGDVIDLDYTSSL